jgi:hypothetical protein
MATDNTLPEALRVTLEIVGVFDQLGISCAVAGSMASSAHGIPRSTQDVDIVAALRPRHVDGLVSALGDAWYADREMISEAIACGASFNVIHLDTMFKADVFVAGRGSVTEGEIERRQLIPVGGGELSIVSPEDIVAQKLRWYRLGGEVSDRQWQDVLGVLRVQTGVINLRLLRRLAVELKVEDLLERAMEEAEQG